MLDQTIAEARSYLEAGGSKERLATASGITRNTLIGIEREDWSVTMSTLRKVRAGLDKLGSHG